MNATSQKCPKMVLDPNCSPNIFEMVLPTKQHNNEQNTLICDSAKYIGFKVVKIDPKILNIRKGKNG